MGAVKVGIDLIEIERIVRALERPGFRERCFTQAEQEYCELAPQPGRRATRRGSAGKEAVGKALGCGVRFTWKEIEIVGPPKPGVHAHGADGRVSPSASGMRAIDALDDALARRWPAPSRRRRSS